LDDALQRVREVQHATQRREMTRTFFGTDTFALTRIRATLPNARAGEGGSAFAGLTQRKRDLQPRIRDLMWGQSLVAT